MASTREDTPPRSVVYFKRRAYSLPVTHRISITPIVCVDGRKLKCRQRLETEGLEFKLTNVHLHKQIIHQHKSRGFRGPGVADADPAALGIAVHPRTGVVTSLPLATLYNTEPPPYYSAKCLLSVTVEACVAGMQHTATVFVHGTPRYTYQFFSPGSYLTCKSSGWIRSVAAVNALTRWLRWTEEDDCFPMALVPPVLVPFYRHQQQGTSRIDYTVCQRYAQEVKASGTDVLSAVVTRLIQEGHLDPQALAWDGKEVEGSKYQNSLAHYVAWLYKPGREHRSVTGMKMEHELLVILQTLAAHGTSLQQRNHDKLGVIDCLVSAYIAPTGSSSRGEPKLHRMQYMWFLDCLRGIVEAGYARPALHRHHLPSVLRYAWEHAPQRHEIYPVELLGLLLQGSDMALYCMWDIGCTDFESCLAVMKQAGMSVLDACIAPRAKRVYSRRAKAESLFAFVTRQRESEKRTRFLEFLLRTGKLFSDAIQQHCPLPPVISQIVAQYMWTAPEK